MDSGPGWLLLVEEKLLKEEEHKEEHALPSNASQISKIKP